MNQGSDTISLAIGLSIAFFIAFTFLVIAVYIKCLKPKRKNIPVLPTKSPVTTTQILKPKNLNINTTKKEVSPVRYIQPLKSSESVISSTHQPSSHTFSPRTTSMKGPNAQSPSTTSITSSISSHPLQSASSTNHPTSDSFSGPKTKLYTVYERNNMNQDDRTYDEHYHGETGVHQEEDILEYYSTD